MSDRELTRLVCDARLGERGHAGVTGKRSAQHRHGHRSAGALAEPHSEIEQGSKTKLAQQHPMRRLGRDVRRQSMIERVRAQFCQGGDRRQGDEAVEQHRDAALLGDPLSSAAAFGGRELAAILGAALAARQRRIPVLLDGFVCVAAVAPLAKLRADALDHALAAHVSAEAAHRMLLGELRLAPLLDLGMRLGEGSGAAVAVSVLRAALACHAGMATFAEAGVANKPH